MNTVKEKQNIDPVADEFKAQLIEGTMYISHGDLARFVVKQAAEGYAAAHNGEALNRDWVPMITKVLKRNLICLAADPEFAGRCSIIRTSIDPMLDLHAFMILAEKYEWSQATISVMDCYLGEWGAAIAGSKVVNDNVIRFNSAGEWTPAEGVDPADLVMSAAASLPRERVAP